MRIFSIGRWSGRARRTIGFELPGRPVRFPRRLVTAGALAVVALGALVLPLLHAVPVAWPSTSHARIAADATAVPGVLPGAVAKPGAWLKLAPGSGTVPPTVLGSSMAYDAARSAVVLFGGCGPGACPSGSTWSFASGNWTNLTGSLATSPSARTGAVSIFDVHDNAYLLYGGRTASGLSAETWTLGPGGWTEVATTGAYPPARTDARMTYDPTLAGAVLYGGLGAGGKTLGDTWLYSDGTWTDLTATAASVPPARSDAVFVYDPSDGYDLLFGGNGLCGHPCGDTWTFSHHTWSDLTASLASAPAPRMDAGAVSDPSNNGVLVFGGRGGGALTDSWTFASGSWQNLSSLGIRALPGHASPAVAFDVADGYVVALGIRGSGPAVTWAFVLPMQASLLASATFVGPGTGVELTAFVIGGLPPYRFAIDPGTGAPPSSASRIVFTYLAPGTYHAALNVTDSRGVYALDSVVVHVADLPLAVTLSVSPGTVQPGSTATFTATVTGGRAPYSLVWTGLPVNCASSSTSMLSCAPRSAGDYRVTVTVTDARNATSVASAGLTVPAPSTAGSVTGSPVATTTTVLPLGWVLVPPLAAGLLLSTLGAVMMWRATQRSRLPPPPRPICYIPPEWSETPDDYRP